MKNNSYNILYYEFKEWLAGILEDDPIPYEITTLYFFYGKINGEVYIRFCATEFDKEEYSDFTYNPLEAQAFISNNLYKIFQKEKNNIKLYNFIKNSIEKFKKDDYLFTLFSKKIKVKEYNYYL